MKISIIQLVLCCVLSAVLSHAQQPAPVTAEVAVPSGSYHFGTLRFVTAGQSMELQIQFRDGRAIASQIFLDGKYYSPPALGQYAMSPLIESCNLEALRFDGQTLSGNLKWYPNKDVETVLLEGSVKDGVVTGMAGGADLTGWLRSTAQMAKINGFPPGKDWPAWTGPRGDWSGTDSERPLVNDWKEARLLWFSEALIGGGRGSSRDPLVYQAGDCTPILGDGRIFIAKQEATGDIVDEAHAKELEKWVLTVADDRSPAAVQAMKDGPRRHSRVDADEVYIAMDAASGQTLWTTTLKGRSYNPHRHNKHCDDNRTPCYAEGKIYFMGRTCILSCLDAKNGTVLWDRPLTKSHALMEKQKQEALAKKTCMRAPDFYPPLHYAGGVVFCDSLADGIVGYDAATGKLLWVVEGRTPARWQDDGKDFIVFMSNKGLQCLEPKTGATLWTSPVEGTPSGALYLRLLGSYLLCSVPVKGKPHVTVCFRLEKAGPKKLWELADDADYTLFPMHSSAARDGVAYIRYSGPGSGLVKAKVLAVELATGKVLGRADIMGTFIGMIQVDNDRVFVHSDGCHGTTELDVFSRRDLKPLGRFIQPHVPSSPYDSPVAIPSADGRMIFRGRNRIFCYDLRQPAK